MFQMQPSQPKTTPNQLDTPSEFATVIKTTAQTVRKLIRSGVIPTKINVGRVIRIDRAEALDALTARSGNSNT